MNSYHASLMQEPHEVVFLNVHKTGNLRNVKGIILHMLHFEIYLMRNEIKKIKTKTSQRGLSMENLSRTFEPTIYSALSPQAPLCAHLI